MILPSGIGLVHSIESMSAVDGLGLRFLVFLQGCWRRCAFCSNPDTWNCKVEPSQAHKHGGASQMSTDDLTLKLRKNMGYLLPNRGGITCSGGEPLVQAPFVRDLFRQTRALGLTTCLDTSGMGQKDHYAEVLAETDYVMLCTKSLDPDLHKAISGASIRHLLTFVDALDKAKVPFRVRHVLIPEGPLCTGTPAELRRVLDFVNAREHCIGIELLPYHKLGVHKWSALGWEYPMMSMKSPSKEYLMPVLDTLRGGLSEGKTLIL